MQFVNRERTQHMFEHFEREPNFIEKRRQWKGGMEKPVGRRTLMMIMPAIILSVFVLLSAPYLHQLFKTFAGDEKTLNLKSISLEEPEEVKEAPPLPARPEEAMAQYYRDRYDREGFDWRARPEVDPQVDALYARELEIEVTPLDVELPATMAELEQAALEKVE